MRFISETHAYKKDHQREERGQYRFVMRDELPAVIGMLATDTPLPSKYHDHMLIGNWANHGECHLKPDFLLVYMKLDGNDTEHENGELRLVRLGSHSEIFG